MSKYSFLLQSKEAEYFALTEHLRLKKHGGWLVAEAIEQEEISKAQSQATIRAVQLAKRIATTKGIELDEAFALLQGGTDLGEMELLSDFTEETLGMINSGGSIEISNYSIFQRTNCFYVFMNLFMHLLGLSPYSQNLSCLSVQCYNRGFIYNHLIIIHDERIGCSKVNSYLCREKIKKSH